MAISTRRPRFTALLGVLLLGVSPVVGSAQATDLLRAELERLEPFSGGTMGIAAIHLETGREVYLNGDEAFPMASTYKVPIAVQLLTLVDRGERSLSDMVQLDRGDLHPGSGILSRLFDDPGVSLSLENLMELMLLISDNSATDLTLEAAGGAEAVTARMRALGIDGIQVNRPTSLLIADYVGIEGAPDDGRISPELWEELTADLSEDQRESAAAEFAQDPRDTSTPRGMAALLQMIWQQRALSPESTEVLIDVLKRVETGTGRIKGLLPPETVVAHKTGTIGGTTNDVGIIYLPGDAGHVVTVALVKESDVPIPQRERAIAEASRAIHDFFLFYPRGETMAGGVDPTVIERLERINQTVVFGDMHAHPSRFHRGPAERIATEELALYRRSFMDLVTANISTDAAWSGGYVTRDGTEVPRGQYSPAPGEGYALTKDRMTRVLATVESGEAVLARDPAAVTLAREQGKVALIPALEGGDGLEGSVDNLRELHGMGLGLLQLVHFRANGLGHIQTYPYTPGGLTDRGREIVREANRLGIILDLAHANTETIQDVLEISEHPVLFSHGGLKAFRPEQDRALTDDELRMFAEHGGVVGIWPNGSDTETVARMVDYLEHVMDVAGEDHVGIGSDLRGVGSYARGFGEEAEFKAVAAELFRRGHGDETVGKIMGGNFWRVFETVTASVAVSAR